MVFAIIKVIISFAIVCGLIFLCSKIMQHSIHFPQYRTKMKILDQIKVSPKTTLSIVKVGTDYLLIGSGDQQCSLIKELDPELYQDIEQETEVSQPSFKEWNELMSTFWKRRKHEKENK